jgi:hypothetical protein
MKNERLKQQEPEALLRTIDARLDGVKKVTRIMMPVLGLLLFSVMGVVVYLAAAP